MKRSVRSILFLLAACGGDKPAPVAPVAPTVDLGPAIGVVAAKAAGPADKVVVTGRVMDIVKGLAAFRFMDTSLPYCGEANKEDKCTTPWDYCCEKKETIAADSLLVEFHGADGQPLGGERLGDLRLLDLVSVRGKLVKTEAGVVLLADELSRTSRPKIPDYVKWPK